jgi:hypothetical protein
MRRAICSFDGVGALIAGRRLSWFCGVSPLVLFFDAVVGGFASSGLITSVTGDGISSL